MASVASSGDLATLIPPIATILTPSTEPPAGREAVSELPPTTSRLLQIGTSFTQIIRIYQLDGVNWSESLRLIKMRERYSIALLTSLLAVFEANLRAG